jgi:Protein of unknown function (DUF1475)
MIWFLRLLFCAIIGAMLWVTTWASLTEALGDFAAGPVIRNPWVVATLFDAYFAFITVYVWIAWKEQSLGARILWFIAVILLGNLATAAYFLSELFKVPASGPLTEVLATRRPGKLALPGILVALSIGVYLLA